MYSATATPVFQNNVYGEGTLPSTAVACFTVDDPKFQEGTVVPGKGSLLINKGLRLDWMSRDASCQDFYGNPRMVSKPDIGCAESNIRSGFAVFFY